MVLAVTLGAALDLGWICAVDLIVAQHPHAAQHGVAHHEQIASTDASRLDAVQDTAARVRPTDALHFAQRPLHRCLRRFEPDTDAAVPCGKRDQHARLRASAQQQVRRDRSLLIEGVGYAAFGDPELQRRWRRRCVRGNSYEQECERDGSSGGISALIPSCGARVPRAYPERSMDCAKRVYARSSVGSTMTS